MTWQDWIRIAALVAAAVFSGLAFYRSSRAIRRCEQAAAYSRQVCGSLRRVEEIRARRDRN